MILTQKKLKKRSRWGADLDDDADDLIEHGVPESKESPVRSPAQENALKSPTRKRKKSRWGGDKAAEDGDGSDGGGGQQKVIGHL
jgi:hypothetical protein